MVRYSKLAARTLYSRYETHITYTPMMLSREYSRSEKARQAEFSTNDRERGIFTQDGRTFKGALVAQFAAQKAVEFADAVELISPFVDGVDLNCGWYVSFVVGSFSFIMLMLLASPQRWAYQGMKSLMPCSLGNH